MVLNGRTLQAHEHPLQQAADSGKPVGPLELELRLDDGTSRHVLARAVPLFDAQQRVRGAAAAMVDITERKQAEQRVLDADARLRDSQRLVDLAQEAGDVGFFRYRFDNRSVTWTPGAALLLGVAHSERPPAPNELLALVHPADREAVQRRLQSMVDHWRERETIEFRVALAEDNPRWLSCRVMLAFNEDGQPQELVGVTLDISEHKRAERERALLVAGEQAARVEAEAASRAKDEFLAMLGHELRNPLGAIASAVEVLNRVDASSELAVNARLIIARQTRHLAHLMDDLLDVGRVISGKVLLARRRLDLATLVQRVVGNFEVTGATSQHELVLHLDHAWVEVDATRMEQVVSNLLGNAFKYTPAERRIEVSLRQYEGRALLEVRDHGHGIAPELLPRVFDLFVQGERPLDRRAGGLGIGLTLVRRLVELHGGQVGVESSPDGTRFTVSMPAVDPPTEAGSSLAWTQRFARRVLVVEDNEDALAGLRAMLVLDGHAVTTADDGENGLELLLQERPDVAIVDIGLPGLNGYELAKRSRRAGFAGKLIALSGYSGQRDVLEAQRHGFDAHLAKPVDPNNLRELLAQE
jgi:signal transduction histidine kinase